MLIRSIILFFFVTLSAWAQTNGVPPVSPSPVISDPAPKIISDQTNPVVTAQMTEAIRLRCIENRRIICGKILKVLPEGLVVESGYTNLMRYPLNRSWLIPGAAVGTRADNLIENNEPGSVCIGLVFLTDTPSSRRLKPKQYDYVVISAYPAGQYTYTSLGTIHRTVRRFSAVLPRAVELNLPVAEKTPDSVAAVK